MNASRRAAQFVNTLAKQIHILVNAFRFIDTLSLFAVTGLMLLALVCALNSIMV